MPKITKSATKNIKVKAKKITAVAKKSTKLVKKINTTDIKVKAPIKISKIYIPKNR